MSGDAVEVSLREVAFSCGRCGTAYRDGLLLGLVGLAAFGLGWRIDAPVAMLATLLSALAGLGLVSLARCWQMPRAVAEARPATAGRTWAATALPLLGAGLGIEALLLGNTAQWIVHMLLLIVLVRGVVDMSGLRLGEAALKCTLASVALLASAWGLAQALGPGVHPLLVLLLAGGAGAAAYAALCLALHEYGRVQQRRGAGVGRAVGRA